MGRRIISFEEFTNKFEAAAEGEYEYVSGYTRMSMDITVKHLVCGEENTLKAGAFINRPRCKQCACRSKDTETYAAELQRETGGNYVLQSEYVNSETDVELLHVPCGNIFRMKPRNFTTGHRCKCEGSRAEAYTLEEINNICEDKYPNYRCIEVRPRDLVMKCIVCGDEKVINKYVLTRGQFTNNNYCCKKKIKELKRKIKIFQKKVKEEEKLLKKERAIKERMDKHIQTISRIHGDAIELLETGKTIMDSVSVLCNKCGETFNTNFKNLKRGNGCPDCASSKGERAIKNYLISNNINFEREYKIVDSEISKLRFDFCLKDSSDNIVGYLEYDGKQHFKVSESFGSSEEDRILKFERTLDRDMRKNSYCNINNIYLARIPYWYLDQVEEFTKVILEELGLLT